MTSHSSIFYLVHVFLKSFRVYTSVTDNVFETFDGVLWCINCPAAILLAWWILLLQNGSRDELMSISLRLNLLDLYITT